MFRRHVISATQKCNIKKTASNSQLGGGGNMGNRGTELLLLPCYAIVKIATAYRM